MSYTQIWKLSWANAPIDIYMDVMARTKERAVVVETTNQQYLNVTSTFNLRYESLDEVYNTSQASDKTVVIGRLDDNRDIYAMVMENVAKQWMRLPVEAMALRGTRVEQVFRDIDFSTTIAMGAENNKIVNMEQRFDEPQLTEDLAAMGLTEINRLMKETTQQLASLLDARANERVGHEKGEVKAARDAMEAAYKDFVTVVNALIVTGAAPELEPMVEQLNQVYAEAEERIKQSKKQPTVLVTSKVVGNHRYSVPEFATWQTIIDANPKALKVATNGTNRILSAQPKAAKVGGLYLALGTVPVKPVDVVNTKKEYTLLYITPPSHTGGDDGGGDVTPVTPE